MAPRAIITGRGRQRSPANAATKLNSYAINGAIQRSGIVATFWLM